jgi:hypothetical protein
VEAQQPGHGRRCSWWLRWRLSGSGATVEVVRRLGFSGEEMRCSHRCLYIGRRQGGGRGTRGIAITSCAEVGRFIASDRDIFSARDGLICSVKSKKQQIFETPPSSDVGVANSCAIHLGIA